MPRRNEMLPFDEKGLRLRLKMLRREFGHLPEYLPQLELEVEAVRKLKEAGEDPRNVKRADDSELR